MAKIIENSEELFQQVKIENDELKKQLDNKNSGEHVDNKLNYYQTQKIGRVQTVSNPIFWIYFIFVFIAFFVIGFNDNLSFQFKIFWLVFFVVYPFVIEYIESTIYFYGKNIYLYFFGEVQK
jgi:hypothetical protein